MKRVLLAALAALLAFPLLVGSVIADEHEEEIPDVYSFIWGLYSSVRGQGDFRSAALGAVATPGPQAVSDLWLGLTGQDDKDGKGKGAAPTTAGPAVAVPSGYRLYPKPGFGLALPNDWTEIDLIDRSRSPRQIVAALPPFSPDPVVDQRFKERLAERIASLRQRDFSFFGFDFEVDGIDTDVTVLRRSIPQGATLDEITDLWVGILEEDPNVVGPISRESVTIPAGPARLIGYGTQAGTVEDRAIIVPTIDLLVQRTTGTANELYVLTFSTVVEPDEPGYDRTIETIVEIVRTFHFR